MTTVPTNIKYSTHNPLGIFAMFISLAYAAMVACFVVGIDKLYADSERLPIVWFLVAYPLIVLGVFTWLLVKHNDKFYSPCDFRSDEAFIKMSKKEVATRREQEGAEARADMDYQSADDATKTDKPQIPTARELMSRAAEAEDLSIKYLAHILHIDFARNMKISLHGRRYELDAVGDGQYGKYIVECKYAASRPAKSQMQAIGQRLFELSSDLTRDNIPHRIFLTYVLGTSDHATSATIRDFFKANFPGLVVYVMTCDQLKEKLANE